MTYTVARMNSVVRGSRRAGFIAITWIVVVTPALVFGGRHFWGIPGALTGMGVALAVYFWRYWIYITKIKLVWEEEEITRERTRREAA